MANIDDKTDTDMLDARSYLMSRQPIKVDLFDQANHASLAAIETAYAAISQETIIAGVISGQGVVVVIEHSPVSAHILTLGTVAMTDNEERSFNSATNVWDDISQLIPPADISDFISTLDGALS